MSTLTASPIPEYLEALGFRPSGREDCVAVKQTSFEEYLRIDTEGRLAEWVDGETRVYMANTLSHQSVLSFLHFILVGVTRRGSLGKVLSAGYAMQDVRGGSGREPDLVFVRSDHEQRLQNSHLVGHPDLVIEIVSQDSPQRDYVEKFREYESAGIPEYWVIDPRPGRRRADFFVLRAGRYEASLPDGGGVYRTALLPGFWLRLNWLWDDSGDPTAALEEILAGEPA